MLAELRTQLATTLGFPQLTPSRSGAATKLGALCICRSVPQEDFSGALDCSQVPPCIPARNRQLSSYPLRFVRHSARTIPNRPAT